MSIVISTTQVTHRELELDVESPAAKPIGLRRTSVQPSSGTLSQGILRGGPLIRRLNCNHLPLFETTQWVGAPSQDAGPKWPHREVPHLPDQ
jgi:hypothetical protein